MARGFIQALISVKISDRARKWLLIEEERNERLVHLFHVVVGLLLVALAVGTRIHFANAGDFAGTVIGGSIISLFGVIGYFYLTASRYRRSIKYVVTIFDLAVLVGVLVSMGGDDAFKGFGILVYYLIIAASALRYSPRLTLVAGIGSIIAHSGLFVWCVASGGCQVGTTLESFTSQAVSPALFGQQIALMAMFVLLTLIISQRFRAVITRSIENELNAAREREITDRARSALRRFVTDDVADLIMENKIGVQGDPRTVTILFADIRDFTRMSESMKPAEIVALLNDYFGAMIGVIFDHSGTLDKFIGDGIMAVFGAPISSDRDEEMALRAALGMREMLEIFNAQRVDNGQNPIRIGIHTGVAIASYIGNDRRIEYTVIGPPVNLASRNCQRKIEMSPG